MIIQHNMTAANANRQLGMVVTSQAKSTEKLSSGYRINRAADDAAGLSISEKMRGQIRGLEQASTNAQDGISLIQTAEGALNETHAILQRMRELSVQAANGTTTSEDRDSIQSEISQLQEEIDRIADTTEFNTMKLLDGSFKSTLQIGANSGQTMAISVGDMSAKTLGITEAKVKEGGLEGALAGQLEEGKAYTVREDENGALKVYDKDNKEVGTATELKINGEDLKAGDSFYVGDEKAYNFKGADADKLKEGVDYTVTNNGGKLEVKAGNDVVIEDATGMTLDNVAVKDGDAFTFGQTGLVGTHKTAGLDVTTTEGATLSLEDLDSAIKSVSAQRSSLGAIQNRLEHTIANLDTSAENLQTAESRIRDVDMAEEMVNYTKNNILQQAAQSMLAQANQSTQGVLSLLG